MSMAWGFVSFVQILSILATVTLYVLAVWALVLVIKALSIYIRNNQ